MRLIVKLFAPLLALFSGTSVVHTSDFDIDRFKLVLSGQKMLFEYVETALQRNATDWKSVAVLVDFESQPIKKIAYQYFANGTFDQLQIDAAPAEIWSNLFNGYTMVDVLLPKQMLLTRCRGYDGPTPVQVSYQSTTFGGVNLGGELSKKDHEAIAEAVKDDCQRDDQDEN